MSTELTDMEFDEVSLVDEGANQEAFVILFKRDFSTDERKELAEKGFALPDGSFPIVNMEDLRNAVQAFGRANNPEEAKRHIIKRAKALGMTEILPEGWMNMQKSSKIKTFVKSVVDALGADSSGVDEMDEEKLWKQFITESDIELESHDSEEQMAEEIVKVEDLPADLPEGVKSFVQKLHDQLVAAQAELTKTEPEVTEPEAVEAEVLKSADPAVAELVKSYQDQLTELQRKADQATEIAKREREARLDREFSEKVEKEFGFVVEDKAELASLLKRLYDSDAGLAGEVEGILKSANGRIESGEMFAEIGKSTPVVSTDAEGKLETLTKSIQERDSIDYSTAYIRAMEENPSVYAEYLKETQ
jgi:hypothetical protein